MAAENIPSEKEPAGVTTREYRLLFNALSESIQEMERLIERMKLAQAAAEELCIRGPGPKKPLVFVPQPGRRAAK